MARKTAKKCSWCGKEPLGKIEIGLSKKLLEYQPPVLLCLACLAEELNYDQEELKYLAEKFSQEGCELFL